MQAINLTIHVYLNIIISSEFKVYARFVSLSLPKESKALRCCEKKHQKKKDEENQT